ncbi:hypothetical protein JMA_39430 (plasmid) [Jeotgalibacillus malaysiensis]|uniref:Uncharacterized protein n=1 Tax=Jeotgalibacillus malaysiensis TaxID=1508404 RepID=A0A0B5AT07_9BACL|nr:hypothetical protein JMA_39430 [Jeotgalibacillus malaysiensis]
MILEEYIPADKVTIHFEDKVFQSTNMLNLKFGLMDSRMWSQCPSQDVRLQLEKRMKKEESVNK